MSALADILPKNNSLRLQSNLKGTKIAEAHGLAGKDNTPGRLLFFASFLRSTAKDEHFLMPPPGIQLNQHDPHNLACS